jgi:hypothetical protein
LSELPCEEGQMQRHGAGSALHELQTGQSRLHCAQEKKARVSQFRHQRNVMLIPLTRRLRSSAARRVQACESSSPSFNTSEALCSANNGKSLAAVPENQTMTDVRCATDPTTKSQGKCSSLSTYIAPPPPPQSPNKSQNRTWPDFYRSISLCSFLSRG